MSELDGQAAPGAVLRLGGRLTIATAPETKQSLLAALDGGGPIELAIEADSEVDLSFVQMLAAAALQAERSGTRLAVRRPLPQRLDRIMAEGGFGALSIEAPRGVA